MCPGGGVGSQLPAFLTSGAARSGFRRKSGANVGLKRWFWAPGRLRSRARWWTCAGPGRRASLRGWPGSARGSLPSSAGGRTGATVPPFCNSGTLLEFRREGRDHRAGDSWLPGTQGRGSPSPRKGPVPSPLLSPTPAVPGSGPHSDTQVTVCPSLGLGAGGRQGAGPEGPRRTRGATLGVGTDGTVSTGVQNSLWTATVPGSWEADSDWRGAP